MLQKWSSSSDRSTFMRVEFNSKYKYNHETRNLLDMEKEIKSSEC